MSDERITSRVAELTERILDEVSSSDQDWRNIASRAGELAQLAGAAAASSQELPEDG